VTGAGGQVGRALRAHLPGARFAAHADLDVTDGDAVRAAVAGAATVVHLAALTNVDGCERDPDAARRVNADGTSNICAAATEAGARVVYVSTDYVFPGDRDGEWEEDDPPAPLNVYGRTKLLGEEEVGRAPANLVVRTSWVFGDGRNFVRTILAAAGRGAPLRVVADQRGRPTWAGDVARAIAALVGGNAAGIVHVAGDGPACTWADLARAAVAEAGVAAPVEPVTTAEYAASAAAPVAPRPANSTLSLARARRLGVPLGGWRDALRRYVREAA
jgi:dTDP-4-dehydrorhamnose reductase